MKKRLQKKAEKIKQTAVKAAENMQETAEKVMDKVVEEAPIVAKTISSKTEEIMNSPVVKEGKETVEEVKKSIRTRVSEVNLEIFETSVSISAIEKAVKKAVSSRKLKGEIKIYINIEQRMAYYTVNGEGSEEFKIDLKSL